MQRDIHLFEPSGYAGVFQHACRVAQLLSREGHSVVVHTGHEHEDVPGAPVEVCGCSWWPRGGSRGSRRTAAIGQRFISRTLPHLREATEPDAVLHLQGIAAAGPLNLVALAAARAQGRRVVYSPHDTFSRRGRVDAAILRLALRVPHAVVVHTKGDLAMLRAAGVVAHYAPLVQLVPVPAAEGRRRWREEWGAADGEKVVLFAGWIRPEKRLDLVIESARTWPAGRRLAVVGQDRGAWAACSRLARSHGVEVAARIGFVDLDEFAAAISAADVVVASHERASQSGVLSLARQLGVPAVAADVGGLGELASRTFPPGDVTALSRALDEALAGDAADPAQLDERLALEAHLRAYGLTR